MHYFQVVSIDTTNSEAIDRMDLRNPENKLRKSWEEAGKMICRVERLVDYKIYSKFEHSPPSLSRMFSLRLLSSLNSLYHKRQRGWRVLEFRIDFISTRRSTRQIIFPASSQLLLNFSQGFLGPFGQLFPNS